MYDQEVKIEKKELEKKQKEKKKKENSVLKNKINVQAVLKKLSIFMVVAFLFIFITTKFGQKSENKVFEKNLENIKNASYKYFKENKRPTENNEEYTITLQELIDGNYIQPIKDKKGNSCNNETSDITIEKKNITKYDLAIQLNCESQKYSENYSLTYATTKNSNNNSIDSSVQIDHSTSENTDSDNIKVYYKLKKGVSSNSYQYSCPSGYVLNGRYCYSSSFVMISEPMARYKSISTKVKKASYKKENEKYEYVDPIITKGAVSYSCSNPSATLEGDKCVLKRNYTESNSCPSDYPKKDGDECYYVDKATQEWSDWKYVSTNSFSSTKKSTETKKYTLAYTYQYGNKKKYMYEYYTRKKIYTCDEKRHEDVKLKGTNCYHYIDAKNIKTCPTGYQLNDQETECIKYTSAKKIEEKASYSCPEGYEKKGTGSNTKCYIKTTTEGYYYCKNSNYRLENDQCILDGSTEFIGYKCPTGYSLSNNKCIKTLSGDKISATKTNDPIINTTYKWSSKKSESGWVWTGETKEI